MLHIKIETKPRILDNKLKIYGILYTLGRISSGNGKMMMTDPSLSMASTSRTY